MNYIAITLWILLGTALIIAAFYFGKKFFEFNSCKKLTSIILHEIKNNITVLKWHIELFGKNKDISKEEALHKLDSVIGSMADTVKQGNNIFYTRKKDAPLINIIELINKELDIVNAYAEKKRIKINTKMPEELEATIHPSDFQTVLRNILLNAICYSPENSKLGLKLWRKKRNCFLVVENKIELNNLKQSSSTGIGLEIVKHILKKYKGKFEANNTSDGYYKAQLRFPL